MLNDLYTQLNDLNTRYDQGEDVLDEVTSIRAEIRRIEEIKASNIIFRVRARWTELGERPSAYYLNLEKRKRHEGALTSVMSKDGVTLTGPAQILNACKDFYANLYADHSENLMPIEEVQDTISSLEHPILSDQARAELDAEPTKEEMKAALDQLNTGKSPGTDGVLHTILGPIISDI